MEWSANLLLKHFRTVLIRSAFDNYVRVRFRADSIRNAMVYFGKVPSQIKRWHDKGGALISYRNDNKEGPHDAIVFVECPKYLNHIRHALKNTASVGVIYIPQTWQAHHDTIEKRFKDRPRKLYRARRCLDETKSLELLPEFTYRSLLRVLRAQQATSQSSSSHESREAVAPLSDTPR